MTQRTSNLCIAEHRKTNYGECSATLLSVRRHSRRN